MGPVEVIIESGKKKTFASATDWPGWARSGGDETSALQALVDYGPRYAQVLRLRDIAFQPPIGISGFVVAERHPGSASTDFGAPGAIPEIDKLPLDINQLGHLQVILLACWEAFDIAVNLAQGKTLRKGPRGGGRDVDKIIDHVIEGQRAYLRRIAWKPKRITGISLHDNLQQIRQAVLDALRNAVTESLPERGPRGGVIWPPPYFIRRSAWHILDHAWEIEDRIL
jgi:hypothetical protein